MTKIPNIPKARYTFDFKIMPSLIFNEHNTHLIGEIILSEGEFLAYIMNDFYKEFADENNYELEDESIFSKDDFDILTGKLDDTKMMTMIEMPKDDGDDISCYLHILVYDLTGFENIRLFTVERSASDVEDIMEFLSFLNEEISLDNVADSISDSFLCEIKADRSRLNYGSAPNSKIEIVQMISEIIKGE